ncbi:MAG: SigE family RNA polymerase sigma factor [Acidimicrobiia bacterium]|nr:SigE family RNA polymerase sigma factor [Acidimicrobiia bacterium]
MPRRHDEPAEAFCLEMHPRLVALLGLHLGDRGRAEDLAQETLVRVWERWSRVSRAGSPEAYTVRIAYNLASSWFRRRAREEQANRRAATERPAAEPPDPGDVTAVREALAALPPRQREVVLCRYLLDLDVATTAAAMGCAPGTVKALTHQALASLRRAGLDSLTEVADHA